MTPEKTESQALSEQPKEGGTGTPARFWVTATLGSWREFQGSRTDAPAQGRGFVLKNLWAGRWSTE